MIEFEIHDFKVLPKHDGHGARVIYPRDKHGRAGKPRIHWFIPKKKQENVEAIREAAEPFAPDQPWTGPIRLDLTFVFQIPKSWTKRRRRYWMGGPHIQLPDRDNIAKQITDALQDLFYLNDKQVCCGETVKAWGDKSFVRVRLTEIEAPDDDDGEWFDPVWLLAKGRHDGEDRNGVDAAGWA